MDFFTYWTLDKGAVTYQATSEADAITYMVEGSFIGYWLNNTYEMTHTSYCSAKKSGKAYITQHTTDRKNIDFATINTSNYYAFVIMVIW